jgi:hypothetical protein
LVCQGLFSVIPELQPEVSSRTRPKLTNDGDEYLRRGLPPGFFVVYLICHIRMAVDCYLSTPPYFARLVSVLLTSSGNSLYLGIFPQRKVDIQWRP